MLWMTRNRQIIAATVILAHHASEKPAEETMFWMVPRDRTPKNVPMMLPHAAGEHRAADDGRRDGVHLHAVRVGDGAGGGVHDVDVASDAGEHAADQVREDSERLVLMPSMRALWRLPPRA